MSCAYSAISNTKYSQLILSLVNLATPFTTYKVFNFAFATVVSVVIKVLTGST